MSTMAGMRHRLSLHFESGRRTYQQGRLARFPVQAHLLSTISIALILEILDPESDESKQVQLT